METASWLALAVLSSEASSAVRSVLVPVMTMESGPVGVVVLRVRVGGEEPQAARKSRRVKIRGARRVGKGELLI